SPLTLDAGVYWIVPVPQLDADVQTAPQGTRWNWLNSTQTSGAAPQLIDPDGVLGADPNWTEINTITGGGFDAMAFAIYDKDLGVIKNQPVAKTQVYPNPVKSQLTIQLPAGVKVQTANIVDVLGKSTPIKV